MGSSDYGSAKKIEERGKGADETHCYENEKHANHLPSRDLAIPHPKVEDQPDGEPPYHGKRNLPAE
jgi:hypothetical protein